MDKVPKIICETRIYFTDKMQYVGFSSIDIFNELTDVISLIFYYDFFAI